MTPRGRKRVLWLALGSALALFGFVGFLRTHLAWDNACTLARRTLPALLGLEVGIGQCEVDPLTRTLKLRGLSLFLPKAEEPLLAVDRAEFTIRSVQPFWRKVELESLRLSRPRINLSMAPGTHEPSSRGCPFGALRFVQMDRIEVRDAEVRIDWGEGRRAEVQGLDADWRLQRGVAEVQLNASRGFVQPAPDRKLPLIRLAATGELDPGGEWLSLTNSELAVDEMTLSVVGRVDQLCSPSAALDAQLFLPLRSVRRVLGGSWEAKGSVWVKAAVSGTLVSPSVAVDIGGTGVEAGALRPDHFSAHVSYADSEIVLEEFVLPAGTGEVTLRGRLGLSGNYPVEVTLDSQEAQFAKVLEKCGLPGAWVDFPVTAHASAGGVLLPTPRLEGDADVRVGRFLLATRPFDAPEESGRNLLTFAQADVNVGVRVLADRVDLHDFKVTSGRSQAQGDVSLFFDAHRGLLIRSRSPTLDLSDFGYIAGFRWQGQGAAEVVISGPYSDPKIEASYDMRDFEFWNFALGVVQGRLTYGDRVLAFPAASGQKGKTQYQGFGELRFEREKDGGLWAVLKVSVPKGRTEDLVDILLPLHSSIELLQGEVTGEMSGSVDVDSRVDDLAGTMTVALRNTLFSGRRLGDGSAVLRFVGGRSLDLEKTTLKGPLGTFSAEGSFGFDGPIAYEFRGDDVSTAELLGGGRAGRWRLHGPLTFVGRMYGDRNSPVVSAYLTSSKLMLGEASLGDVHLEGTVAGRDLTVWGKPFTGGAIDFNSKLKEPFPYTATLQLALNDLKAILPNRSATQGMTGSLRGTVSAEGNFRESKSLAVHGAIEQLVLQKGEFAGENVGRTNLSYAGGRFGVDSFLFRGHNTELSMAGWLGPENMDFKVHGSADLRLLEVLGPVLEAGLRGSDPAEDSLARSEEGESEEGLSSVFERLAGRLDVAAAATGSFRAPSISGSAEIREARAVLRDQPVAIRGLSGRAEFSEARILLQDVHGTLNEGRAALRGDIRLEKSSVKHLELGLQIDEVSLNPLESVPLTVTGELLLYGAPRALVLGGDLDLLKFHYERPVVLETLIADIRKRRSGRTPAANAREWLTFDVGIHARGDVRLDNNLAKTRLTGDLRLTGTNLRPGLLGTIETVQGGQLFFRGSQFAITQGLLEFKDKRSVDAVFDLHAQSQVREYLVHLHAFGRTSDAQFVLTSEPELSEGDILSLLALGVTSKDRSLASEAGAGLAAEALFNASGLDRQVQKFLPRNPLLRDLSFHISTTYNDATGLVEPTAQLESKFLTEQLKLEMSQPVLGKGTKAQAEYRFHDRLSAEAQWDSESSGYSFGNLGLLLKLRWEVE